MERQQREIIAEIREIQRLKRLVTKYAESIGLEDYHIRFDKKGAIKKPNEITLENKKQADYWIDRINESLKIDLRESKKNAELVIYRQSMVKILFDKGINKYAISLSIGFDHTNVLYSLKKANNYVANNDAKFMPYYNEIEKFFNEFENNKLC